LKFAKSIADGRGYQDVRLLQRRSRLHRPFRIYAGKRVYDNLVADLSRAANELKLNLPNDDENEIGPLISSTQKGRAQGFVERAGGQKQMSITAGGKSPAGNDQAVACANDDYGLASSVWTSDTSKGLATAARLHFGCTWVNTHFMLVNEMPHGGLKAQDMTRTSPCTRCRATRSLAM
jgi:aminobutyraldehyde dehydrogenase